MKKLFGTDGIRGEANRYPIIPEIALKIGMAAAIQFRNGNRRHKFIIGKDTRISGYMLETAMTSGIISMGGDVLLTGPFPTPGIAFLTGSMRADAGIVISASHNPYYDNGIKFFDRNGYKLPDEIENRIEQLLENPEEMDRMRVPSSRLGKARRISDARGRYIVFLKSTFPIDQTLEGMKIALDCANGATYRIAPEVFSELGADVIPVGVNPDGFNINDNCGALYPENIAKIVRESGADAGIAFDGDGDRVIMVDEKGEIVDGDDILAMLASRLLEEDSLPHRTIVGTVMTNGALEQLMKEKGGKLIRTPVGDRYVAEKMREGGFILGGENSGHIIYAKYSTTGDGILTALQVLALMTTRGKPLSELRKIIEKYPQLMKSFRYREKKELSSIDQLNKLKEEAMKDLGESGRILIRYSGTEPKVRIMVEADDEEKARVWLNRITELLKKELGEDEEVRS